MIIRSQDKKGIYNFNKMDNLQINKDERGFCVAIYFNENDMATMGVYHTEEKAIKVLDMICSFADGQHYEQVRPDQCGYIGGAVFQMPLDEEITIK